MDHRSGGINQAFSKETALEQRFFTTTGRESCSRQVAPGGRRRVHPPKTSEQALGCFSQNPRNARD
jgi:hypothetical protein